MTRSRSIDVVAFGSVDDMILWCKEIDVLMEAQQAAKKRPARERYLYKGHVVHSGQIVKAGERYFRVARIWGQHITLEPLSITEVPEPALAIPITIQAEARK